MTSSRIRRGSASPGLAALLCITFILVSAAALDAQVVSDPRVAEFDPSPDHWEVLDNGEPALARYELSVYLVGSSQPISTVDMGKPSPDADGKIRYDFASAVAGWSLPGGDYEARVSAVGPAGAALSDPSNPFTFTTTPACTFSLSPKTVSASASSGNYEVTVSAGAGCEWYVTTALPWVTLWTGGGSGNGTAAFAVLANSSSSSRTGTIDIAGQTVTITQDGAAQPCSYGLSSTSASVPAAGGSASFTVTAARAAPGPPPPPRAGSPSPAAADRATARFP